MAELLRMPAVTADAESAFLASWSVDENTEFAAEDILAEIETDKASVQIEAEAAGVIIRTLAAAGSDVPVGAPIALVAAVGETIADVDSLLADLGVDGHSSPSDRGSGPAAAPDPAAAAVPEEPAAHAEATLGETLDQVDASAPEGLRTGDPVGAGRPLGTEGERLFVSPLARRMARDAGLDLDGLTGSGPHGRIRRVDVEAAVALAAASSKAVAPAVEPDPATDPAPVIEPDPATEAAPIPAAKPPVVPTSADRPAVTGYTDHPHSRIRRIIASRLTASKQTVPHFYLTGSARVEKLMALRSELNADNPVRISVNDLIVKAAARALALLPAMNVIWTEDALRQFDHVDVSIAVASERGLVTPTLRAVEQMSIGAVSTSVKDFVQRAGAGKLRPEELEGGAFSVTNLGMYGVEDFAAIINPPQSAILAIGAARDEAVVQDGQVVVGRLLRVTLSVDHRAIDGALAAEWLRLFLAIVEKPLRILS